MKEKQIEDFREEFSEFLKTLPLKVLREKYLRARHQFSRAKERGDFLNEPVLGLHLTQIADELRERVKVQNVAKASK